MAVKDYASNTISTDTSNFGTLLSSDEDNVQKALDVIDDGVVKLDQTTPQTITGGLIMTGQMRQGSVWHIYGGFEGANETIDCDADTWTFVTNATNDLWTGSEADGFTIADDVMTVVNAGDYVGHLSMTVSGLTGKDFHVRVFNVTQNTVMGFPLGISTTGAGNFMLLSMALYLECDAGDELRLEINSADGSDPTLNDAVFYIAYLHD